MKVCVCGKGGVGKSTIAMFLVHELVRRGKEVVVIDSDESNTGLFRKLGLERPPRPLIELAGGKKKVIPLMKQKVNGLATEKDAKSVLIQSKIRVADLPTEFVVCKEGCCLVVIGKIHQALEGCACPIGVLTREFLKRLSLNVNEIAVVDMEAGIEHFGRGIETSVDAVVAVVEPSLESIVIAERIKELATGAGARFAGVIVNKVASDEMEGQIMSELKRREVNVLGVVRHDQEIANAALLDRAPNELNRPEEIVPIVNTFSL
ncbi:MAG: P-loop NTPase [Candidatus Hydrogenedentes bacterium]|nr:P-loop NTPase [Candidatus Hydrogenedentota bacterium]